MVRALSCCTTAALLSGMTVSAQDVRIPAGQAGTVTLSRGDYDRLLDLANARPRPGETAPVPAALTRADIRVRAAGASARATMRVDGEAFRPGLSKVTL